LRNLLKAAAVAAVAIGVCGSAYAQDYPTRTITLVVPYPPGGGVDAMARVVAERLAGVLGQQVVVDNRAGGSGLVGTRTFIKNAPDGYTLFLGHTGSISINPSLYANAAFDPRKDFAPIGLIASMPVALLANPAFPARKKGRNSTSAPLRWARAAISRPNCSSRSPASKPPSSRTRAQGR
jgi:tripartite-type tricarboxylate transporter receptor subunit TctC